MRQCSFIILWLAALPVWSAEKKIQMKDLPAAVQQAVKAQSAGATVKGFTLSAAKEVLTGRLDDVIETATHNIGLL